MGERSRVGRIAVVVAVGLFVALVAATGCGSSKSSAAPGTEKSRGAVTTTVDNHGRASRATKSGTQNPTSKTGSPDKSANGTQSGTRNAGGDHAGSGAGAGSDAKTGPSAGGATESNSKGSPADPPPAAKLPQGVVPKVVDLARSSVQEVVLLHDVAVGLAHPNGLPGNPAADQAAQLIDQFSSQSAELGKLGSSTPLTVAAYDLRDSLSAYAGFAKSVQTAAISKSKALPAKFATRLAAVDATWQDALTQIEDAQHVDLLSNLPPLLMPSGSPSTVPPPPQ